MSPPARSYPALATRLFASVALIVALSIGLTLGIGLVLTRRSVEAANLADLGHQADLLAQREREALLPFARLGPLRPFFEKQNETFHVVRLGKPSRFVTDAERLRLRQGDAVQGRRSIDGREYLYAARLVKGKGFVLLRPAGLSGSDWWPFLQALLIAGLVGATLAAAASYLSARAISRPVQRVAAASRKLAAGSSPEPLPLEGSAELVALAESFNDMAVQLAAARDAERAFLLSVSHELKTPLTAIRGYAEGLREGVVTADDASETIGREAGRLERLVRDLLDLARMNRSEFTVNREPIDLGDAAREAVRRYEVEARSFGISLEATAARPSPALADLDRVLQVISNLVENALRSTPPGGLVRVRAEPGVVVVEDTGRGLPEDELPRAFERFFLYDRHAAGRVLGTGLGLAIVKELTEAMGGSVQVHSTVGLGATFVVRLPRPPEGTRPDTAADVESAAFASTPEEGPEA
ncbi:MAG: sensor histidine kinase [Gaiellaceae bacterium]